MEKKSNYCFTEAGFVVKKMALNTIMPLQAYDVAKF
jgi:hypothetical protein